MIICFITFPLEFLSTEKILRPWNVPKFSKKTKNKKTVNCPEPKSYGEWLGDLELFGLEKKRLRGVFIPLYNSLNTYLFQVTCDRKKDNSLKLCQERLDIRKNSLSERVVMHMNVLPREMGDHCFQEKG